NTTINGGEKITLSGPVIGYLIVVEQQTVAALKSLTITNVAGFPPPYFLPAGFGLLNEGTLTITSSNLTGNDGGAIHNHGTLAVRDSAISHNGFAFIPSCVGILNDGTLTLSGSTLEGNSGWSGGAICNAGGEATIDKTTFISNQSDHDGGGIVSYGTPTRPFARMTIKNVSLSGNGASTFGGAISIFAGSTFTVTSSTFEDNIAVESDGGAIVGVGSIRNSVFARNHSAGAGGALVFGGVIENSTFTDNTSGVGGALYGNPTITNSTFSNNHAAEWGGAIHTGCASITITNSSITENSAGDTGGGIFLCSPDELTLKNTSVTNNTPDNIGLFQP